MPRVTGTGDGKGYGVVAYDMLGDSRRATGAMAMAMTEYLYMIYHEQTHMPDKDIG